LRGQEAVARLTIQQAFFPRNDPRSLSMRSPAQLRSRVSCVVSSWDWMDNVLKPLMLGRGSKVTTAAIFIGVIGGFVAMGIVGLSWRHHSFRWVQALS